MVPQERYIALVIFICGVLLRIGPVVIYQDSSQVFPLGDGGLFYKMTQELDSLALPEYTQYNQQDIPYAYSPLGFILPQFIHHVSGISLLTIFAFLPAIISSLILGVSYFLYTKILNSPIEVLSAFFVFAVWPGSFDWLILGGSIPRALGMLFMVSTFYFTYDLYQQEKIEKKTLSLTILFASLTILSHLGIAWTTILVCGFLWFWHGRSRLNIVKTIMVGVGVLTLTSVWWLQVIPVHGIHTLQAAFSSRNPLNLPLTFLFFPFSGEKIIYIWIGITILAILDNLIRQKWYFPMLVMIIFSLSNRNATSTASIFIAIVIGQFFSEVIWENWYQSYKNNFIVSDLATHRTITSKINFRLRWLIVGYATGLIGLAIIFNSWISMASQQGEIFNLSQSHRNAMEWLKNEDIPESSQFLIITQSNIRSGQDTVQEWFPALTPYKSVLTTQGTEWLHQNSFYDAEVRHEDFKKCYIEGIDCVMEWQTRYDINFEYIYVAMNSTPLAVEYRYDPAYEAIYQQDDIVIYHRRIDDVLLDESAD